MNFIFQMIIIKKNNECFPDGNIYITINLKEKYNCGHQNLYSLYEIEIMKIIKKKYLNLKIN